MYNLSTQVRNCVLDPIITCSIIISLNNGFTNNLRLDSIIPVRMCAVKSQLRVTERLLYACADDQHAAALAKYSTSRSVRRNGSAMGRAMMAAGASAA